MPAGSASFIVSHLIEGRAFALASFIFVLYDYLITFDDETDWNPTCTDWIFLVGSLEYLEDIVLLQSLFPATSYDVCAIPSSIMNVVIDQLLVSALLSISFRSYFLQKFETAAFRINFPLNILALVIIQATLVIRTWYLFTHSRAAQWLIVAAYALSTAATIVTLVGTIPGLHSHLEHVSGQPIFYCTEPLKAQNIVFIFVPSFFLHAVLSAFMVARVVHNVRSNKHQPWRQAVMKDGGFLYLVVFFSASFSISAAIFGDSPSIGVVAMFANFMLALTSICVSRVVLHLMRLSSLHASSPFSGDPSLLLYTAQANRSRNWDDKFMGCLLYIPPPTPLTPINKGFDDVIDNGSTWKGYRSSSCYSEGDGFP
ncbi:hypothetical protein HGRIS_008593 [Hohenbuehelia grisea]|uniref:Uncharacterized protein n=1 Tax=Hohenbuehelia grisea TaxID=104357 RepID=A0ABR3J9I0_9AGAR